GRMYYGALILVSCDTPARNKICGFSSHSSKHACFKCKKIFKANDTSDQSNIDNYSLFDQYGQLSDNSESYLVLKRIIKASALELCSEYFGSDFTCSDL
ncbi:2600_t:CDS:2, partial [Cetraspora pellucida]